MAINLLKRYPVNAFCPTGPGGGQDNSCSSRKGGGGPNKGASHYGVPTPSGRSHTSKTGFLSGKGGDFSKLQSKYGLSTEKMGEAIQDYLDAADDDDPDYWGGKIPSPKAGYEDFDLYLRETTGDYTTDKTDNSSVGNRFHSARRQRLEAKTQGVLNMTRDGIVDALVSNCDCFDEEDRDTLNSFGDKKLVQLYRSLIGNAMYEDEEEEEAPEEAVYEDEEEEAPAPQKQPGGFFQKRQPAMNRRNDELTQAVLRQRQRRMSAQEWFATAPPEVKSAVQNAMKLEKETKKQLLARLTANVADDKAEQVLNSLKDKSIDELEGLMALVQSNPHRGATSPSFIGASVPYPGHTSNEQAISADDDDGLPLPTLNYAAEAAAKKARKIS